MTSIGEVMSIGRSFEEAIQKALRMVSSGANDGFEADHKLVESWDLLQEYNNDNSIQAIVELDNLIRQPSLSRLTAIASALEIGYETI